MFSLQKFFSKDTGFYDLFETSAGEANKAAQFLQQILAKPSDTEALKGLKAARTRSKEIFEEVSGLVVKTFVTALDKEDIEAINWALYKMPKPMEKFAERYIISKPLIPDVDFSKQVGLVAKGADIVFQMVKELRKGLKLDRIQRLSSSLHSTEEEADVLELELLRELYNSPRSGLKVTIIKEQYHLLEKSIDRCRDAGNVVAHIFLKNS